MRILFSPGRIGSIRLRNRFVRSATRELLASDDGKVTEPYRRTYLRLSKGGVGLIITGSFYVNSIGLPSPRVIVIDNDLVIEGLREVTEVVHEYGGKIVAQLCHGGRQSDPKISGMAPVGPSPIRDRLTLIKPRTMSQNQIEETISDFGRASRRCKLAGFDGVQIQAGHGYLINQFLSPYTNKRNDRWGGTLENRMRFLLAVYQAIRSETGPSFPVLVKVNGEDFVPKGITVDETIVVCKTLDRKGIDAIEVSGGIGENCLVTAKGDIPKDLVTRDRNIFERIFLRLKERKMRRFAEFEEAYFLSHAAAIKNNVKAPVIAVGGLRKLKTMEHILETGQADFIAMCRPFIRQPNLANVIQRDLSAEISCCNCNRCAFEILFHHNPLKCYNFGSL